MDNGGSGLRCVRPSPLSFSSPLTLSLSLSELNEFGGAHYFECAETKGHCTDACGPTTVTYISEYIRTPRRWVGTDDA